jgi:hypothetical protein
MRISGSKGDEVMRSKISGSHSCECEDEILMGYFAV